MVYNYYYVFYNIFIMINDSQIFVALLFAMISGFLAIRLGVELYQ